MKGDISLEKFIQQVKNELIHAQTTEEDAFCELQEINLEVSFAVNKPMGLDSIVLRTNQKKRKVARSYRLFKRENRSSLTPLVDDSG